MLLRLIGLSLLLSSVVSFSAAASERTLVSVRGRNERALRTLLAAQQNPARPEYHRWITPSEFGRRFGAAPADLKRVERWLRAEGCAIRRAKGRQQVECVGARPGPVPAAIAPLVDGVIDLQQRLPIRHDVELRPNTDTGGVFSFSPQEYAGFFDLAMLQDGGIDGTGQRIGIVGTAPVDPTDIDAFRTFYGLPALDLEQIGTPGANLDDTDLLESVLDVSWSGGVAPGAAVTLSITQGTVVDALKALVNRTDVPVISLSLELIASKRTKTAIKQCAKLFKQAATQGQTVLVASGDFGALVVLQPKKKRGVGPFVSSPFVTAVGGTSPTPIDPADASTYGSEVVWQEPRMASGGGRSKTPRPSWQMGSATRTVPDVSLPASGVYPIPQNGQIRCCAEGTSAAAPAWAGIAAMLIQQRAQRVGLLNPTLYRLGEAQTNGGTAVFHDITSGSTDTSLGKGFPAKPGYDLATGWGTPIGSALFGAF